MEEVRRETDRGGSVKLVRNAKGDVQWEIKSYVEDEPGSIDAAAAEALRIHDQLMARFGGGS